MGSGEVIVAIIAGIIVILALFPGVRFAFLQLFVGGGYTADDLEPYHGSSLSEGNSEVVE